MKKKIILTTFVLLWVSQMMAVDYYTINVQSEGCNAVAYTLSSGAVGQIQATANAGYHFTQWSDGNTKNPRTITVTGNMTYTAQYAPDATKYTISVKANGCDLYEHQVEEGKLLVIKAEAGAGYHFVQWNDGNKENPRQIVVMSDMTYTAVFEEDVDGIADITAAGVNIYTEGKTIIVENATEAITVSDALGRLVGRDDAHIVPTETHKFPVPSSGVYVVKIGNRAASVLVR